MVVIGAVVALDWQAPFTRVVPAGHEILVIGWLITIDSHAPFLMTVPSGQVTVVIGGWTAWVSQTPLTSL